MTKDAKLTYSRVLDGGDVWYAVHRMPGPNLVADYIASEADAERLCWVWNYHDEMLEALKDAHSHIVDERMRARIGNVIVKVIDGEGGPTA